MSPPKTLTADQCQALIDYLMQNHGTQKQQVKATRNGVMAIVMLETGIRVGELCGLRIDDLWYAGQPVDNLVVRREIAKNKKERQIPISVKLRDAILLMSSMIWSELSASVPSFAFYSGLPCRALSTRTVERVILDAGRKSFHRDVTPHMLRHTFGSRMMRKTNSAIVQALLGHASLQSTEIYMHPNSEDLKKAINGSE